MLAHAIAFALLSLASALFGFGGTAARASGYFKLLFVLFFVLFVITLVNGGRPRR